MIEPDHPRLSIDVDGASDDRRIGGKATSPKRVCEDYLSEVTRKFLFWQEIPAKRWLYTERPEEIKGDRVRGEPHRVSRSDRGPGGPTLAAPRWPLTGYGPRSRIKRHHMPGRARSSGG